MVGCAAFGCTNRSEKGFSMCKFPKDPIRRKVWTVKVKREGWTPSNSSVLCEVHFEKTMWEKIREDGSKKLKNNAVPTIFSFVAVKKTRKPPATKKLSKTPLLPIAPQGHEDTVTSFLSHEVIEPIAGPSITFVEVSSFEADTTTVSSVECLQPEDEENNAILLAKLEVYEKNYKKLLVKTQKYKKILRRLKILKQSRAEDFLFRVFNKDQIEAMKRASTANMKWSKETVKKALKLLFACGTNGYKELLRQKFPLPSLRTLRRPFVKPRIVKFL